MDQYPNAMDVDIPSGNIVVGDVQMTNVTINLHQALTSARPELRNVIKQMEAIKFVMLSLIQTNGYQAHRRVKMPTT